MATAHPQNSWRPPIALESPGLGADCQVPSADPGALHSMVAWCLPGSPPRAPHWAARPRSCPRRSAFTTMQLHPSLVGGDGDLTHWCY